MAPNRYDRTCNGKAKIPRRTESGRKDGNMAKFKVGDRIEVINPDGTLCQKGDTGTIVSKERKYIRYDEQSDEWRYAVKTDREIFHFPKGSIHSENNSFSYMSDYNMALIEETPTREFKLIITSKGDTTTAKLIHGKDVAKEATVTRYSKDEYSEKAAVEAVVKKIFGEDEKKNEANKPYTGKAVWICDNESVYTKGKIYEFVDGKFKHDLGFTVVGYTLEKMKRLGCFLPIVE